MNPFFATAPGATPGQRKVRFRWAQVPRGCAALLIACGMGSVHALGLGELSLQSGLGEPFRAEVALSLEGNEAVDSGCFKLVSRPLGADDLPWLAGARLELKRGVRPFLRLSTPEPVAHPVLMVGVRVACEFELTREYTLLLEPVAVSSPVAAVPRPEPAPAEMRPARPRAASGEMWQIVEGETLGTIAAALHPRSRSAQRRFIAAAVRANPELFDDPGQAADIPLAAGTRIHIPDQGRPAQPAVAQEPALPRPARRAPHRPQAPLSDPPLRQDRLTIAGDSSLAADTGLRLAESLDLGRTRSVSDAQRDLLRQERRLLAALEDQLVMQLSLAEKIRRMEDALASMKGSLAQVDQALRPEPAPEPPTPLKPAAEVPKPPAPVAAPPQAAPTPALAPQPAEGAGWRDWALAGLFAAGVAAALLWLRTRSRHAQPGDAEAEAADEQPTEAPPLSPRLAEVDFPLDAETPTGRQRPLPALQATAPLPSPELADEHSIDVAEHESAMELAEIMLSFGRVHGAAQTLADYIEANPRHSVQPWLKLLEIYHGAGMRAEFDTVARHLNQTFNIEIPAWEASNASTYPEEIVSYAHVIDRIQAAWGQPECLDYLQHLMRDNRNGTRNGFPVAVLYDILLLIGVLEENLGAQAQRPTSH